MATLLGYLGCDAIRGERVAGAFSSLDDLRTLNHATFEHSVGTLVALDHELAPMGSSAAAADGWYCLADARIDNAEDICRKAGLACPLKLGNAELLLRVFLRFGSEIWDLLRGDFACALWHPQSDRLILARDVVGARPLYWGALSGIGKPGSFAFASELRAMAALSGRSLELDLESVHRYLHRGGSGAPIPDRTLYSHVNRVAPATVLTWDCGNISVRRYWDPRRIHRWRPQTLEAAADEMHRRIVESVRRRCAVRGRLGVHLSGGLDCSSLAGIVQCHKNELDQDPVYFSWTPRSAVGADASEIERIEALAQYHGLDVEYLDSAAYLARKGGADGHREDPCYPWVTLELEQHVQERANVLGVHNIISGWGGDEAASHQGLGLATELLLSGRWLRLWQFLQRPPRPNSSQLLRRFHRDVLTPLSSVFRSVATDSVAADQLRKQYTFRPGHDYLLSVGLSVRLTQLRRYFDGYLTDRMESWYCFGKLKGICYSYPLLDRDVLELAYSLPGWCFFDANQSRAVYRRAVAKYWPAGWVNRVGKDETGLAGFLASGNRAAGSLQEVLKQLRCMQIDHRLVPILDRGRLLQLAERALRHGDIADLNLLSRADWVARLIDTMSCGRQPEHVAIPPV